MPVRLILTDRPESSYFFIVPAQVKEDVLSLELTKTINDWPRFRLFYDNPNHLPVINNAIKAAVEQSGAKITIEDFNTNFFKLGIDELDGFLKAQADLDWNNYQGEFSYRHADLDSPKDQEIVENFLLNSVGVTFEVQDGKTVAVVDANRQKHISATFVERLSNPMIKFYIVEVGEKLVGCFIAVYFNEFKEFYMNWVIGRSTFANMYSGSKLPILLAAVLHVFKESGFLSLTFNSRKEKVVQMYKQLGFKINPVRRALTISRL